MSGRARLPPSRGARLGGSLALPAVRYATARRSSDAGPGRFYLSGADPHRTGGHPRTGSSCELEARVARRGADGPETQVLVIGGGHPAGEGTAGGVLAR